jgi:hypothetical protein
MTLQSSIQISEVHTALLAIMSGPQAPSEAFGGELRHIL